MVDKKESKAVYILQTISIRKRVHNGNCSATLAVGYHVSVPGERRMGMVETGSKMHFIVSAVPPNLSEEASLVMILSGFEIEHN